MGAPGYQKMPRRKIHEAFWLLPMKSTKKNLSQSHRALGCELHQCQQQTSIYHLTLTFGYPEENCNLQAIAEIYLANMGMFLKTASAP